MSRNGQNIDDIENIGVVNPYALAEIKMKKKINWKKVMHPEDLLEKVFDMPYEKLFDPKNNSPLYPGLKIDSKSKKPKLVGKVTDVDIDPVIIEATLASAEWPDPGDFYKEATEMTDPVQGNAPDCYFVAPLSSVAWARPYIIAQKTRPTGIDQPRFVDMVEFYNYLTGEWQKVEVTEGIPMTSNGSFIYARSTETDEIWPAVYEKAFARWRRVTDTPPRALGPEQPDYSDIYYGNAMHSLQELTGLTPSSYSNSALSESDIWNRIVGNCENRKTFNPMVACTYSTGNPNVSYQNTNIVANHCYSILGWHIANSINYVVLRNPWGNTEPVISTDGGTWDVWEQPYQSGPQWHHPIALNTNDGIFALAVSAFKSYFNYFGLVS